MWRWMCVALCLVARPAAAECPADAPTGIELERLETGAALLKVAETARACARDSIDLRLPGEGRTKIAVTGAGPLWLVAQDAERWSLVYRGAIRPLPEGRWAPAVFEGLSEAFGTQARMTLLFDESLPGATLRPVLAGLAQAGVRIALGGPPPAGRDALACNMLRGQTPTELAQPAPPGGELTEAFGFSLGPVPQADPAPAWITLAPQHCQFDGRSVLRAVGSVEGVRNAALAKSTADQRARASIARLLEGVVLEVEAGASKKTIRSLTKATLRGVEIIERYEASDGARYALAEVQAPADRPAKRACELGRPRITWELRGVRPEGGYDGEVPSWAKQIGFGHDAEALWVSVELLPGVRPSAAALLAEASARAGLAEAGAAALSMLVREETALTGLDLNPAAFHAPAEHWWSGDTGRMRARAWLLKSELRAVLPPANADAILARLVAAASRVRAQRSPASRVPRPATDLPRPAWVDSNAETGTHDGVEVLRGVGHVSGVRNQALARSTADNRARAEVAKIVKRLEARLMMAFAKMHAPPPDASTEVPHAHLDYPRTITQALLKGTQIAARWSDPFDGSWHSLAVIELQHIRGVLKLDENLSEKRRAFFEEEIDVGFDSLRE